MQTSLEILASFCIAYITERCSADQLGDTSVIIVSDKDGNDLSSDTMVDSGTVVYPGCGKGFVVLNDDTRTLACNLGKWNGTYACLKRKLIDEVH